MTDTRIVRLLVTGRVQGVGYRAWTHHQAELRGLRGWVRNRADGAVEAVIAGERGAVDLMIEVCRTGPQMARVDRVQVEEGDFGVGEGFEVRAAG